MPNLTELLTKAKDYLPGWLFDQLSDGTGEFEKAKWTRAFINDLPDSAFLYIEPGGTKEQGKTVPRTLRHFPVKDAQGKVDLPHLRNALARIPQSKLSQDVKDKARAKAERMLEAEKEERERERARKEKEAERDGKRLLKSAPCEIICSNKEKRVAYYLVARDGMEDAHGHKISREEIEKGAYGYMRHSRRLKLEHVAGIDDQAALVELFLVPDDMKKFNGEKVIAGDWIVGVQYDTDELWRKVIDDDHGISWGGYARKVEDDA